MRNHPFLLPVLLIMTMPFACSRSNADPAKVPAPAAVPEGVAALADDGTASVVLAGGCFWCTENVFEYVRGVEDVVSGYAGGTADDADYHVVSSGATQHAEAIRITYDPAEISYGELLRIFFTVAHDPTQLDRQGPDHGKQYRSAVFYANDAQKQYTADYIAQLDEAGVYPDKIVTTLEPLRHFYPAEKYHQDYVQLHPSQPYVVYNALPKIEKLKKYFPDVVTDTAASQREE